MKRFVKRLLPEVINLQRSFGGPIIAVQVENEYGMYFNADKNHLRRVFIILSVIRLVVTTRVKNEIQSKLAS